MLSYSTDGGIELSDVAVSYDGWENDACKGLCLYGKLNFNYDFTLANSSETSLSILDESGNEVNSDSVSEKYVSTNGEDERYCFIAFMDTVLFEFGIGLPDDIKPGKYTIAVDNTVSFISDSGSEDIQTHDVATSFTIEIEVK